MSLTFGFSDVFFLSFSSQRERKTIPVVSETARTRDTVNGVTRTEGDESLEEEGSSSPDADGGELSLKEDSLPNAEGKEK